MIIPRLQTCKRCLAMYYEGRVLNNIVGKCCCQTFLTGLLIFLFDNICSSLSTILGLYTDILVNWQTQPTLLQDKHYPLTYSNDHNLRWNGTNLRNTFLHFQKKHSYHWLCLASHTYFILLLENLHVSVKRGVWGPRKCRSRVRSHQTSNPPH